MLRTAWWAVSGGNEFNRILFPLNLQAGRLFFDSERILKKETRPGNFLKFLGTVNGKLVFEIGKQENSNGLFVGP